MLEVVYRVRSLAIDELTLVYEDTISEASHLPFVELVESIDYL